MLQFCKHGRWRNNNWSIFYTFHYEPATLSALSQLVTGLASDPERDQNGYREDFRKLLVIFNN